MKNHNAIECEAVSIIAKRKPTRDELAPLDNAVADMEKALAEDDLAAWAVANTQFHQSLLAHI